MDATKAPEISAACLGNSSVAALIDFGNKKESPKPPINMADKSSISLSAEGNKKNTKATKKGAML